MKIPWTKTQNPRHLNAGFRIPQPIADAIRFAFTLAIFFAGFLPLAQAGETYNDKEIQERLLCLNLPVELHYNTEIRNNIHRYISSGYRDSEKMLGRIPLYFPIFEHELKRMNLPEGLKYLPIIESSLKPDVYSPVGAAGLWQLMRSTARELGLRVDEQVDERLDPYRSTQAALKYLKSLYKRYGNWELAIAAYNSGPGTVNRAIRLGGSKNYWKIKQYLPAETRKYIPRFIAAAYISDYYHEHNILPDYPDYELMFTRTTKVFDYISFRKLSKITRVPISTLARLNPSYLKGYLPGNPKGNFLILPEMGMMAFSDYLLWSEQKLRTDLPMHKSANVTDDQKPTRVKAIVIVEVGNTLEDLAKAYDCTVEQIKAWNELESDALYVKQELILFIPREVQQTKPARA